MSIIVLSVRLVIEFIANPSIKNNVLRPVIDLRPLVKSNLNSFLSISLGTNKKEPKKNTNELRKRKLYPLWTTTSPEKAGKNKESIGLIA